jgi:hypothetical protein
MRPLGFRRNEGHITGSEPRSRCMALGGLRSVVAATAEELRFTDCLGGA